MENLVKTTAKDLNLTYKQLGEAIGYSEAALRNAVTQNNVSKPLKKALEMFTLIKEYEDKNKELELMKTLLKKWLEI